MKYLKHINEWSKAEAIDTFKKISKELTEEELITYIKENCTEFLKDPKIITRGIRPDSKGDDVIEYDYFFSDPSTLNRTSTDCYNYYTLIIDNDPRWKFYPKRSKSFVCTLGYTHMRQNLYYVIPKDGSIWGISPGHDIYVGFKGGKYHPAIDFTKEISKFYNGIMSYGNEHLAPFTLYDKDYNTFIKQLKKLNEKLKTIDTETILKIVNKMYVTEAFKKIIKDNLTDNGWIGDMFKIVKDYFTPERFELQKYIEMKNPNYIHFNTDKKCFKVIDFDIKDKEIWSESTCVFVKENKINDILKKLF